MDDSIERIKKDALDYLTQVANITDTAILTKALAAIKGAAWNEYQLDAEILRDKAVRKYVEAIGLKEGDLFYVRISWNFAPRHYAKIAEFVSRYEAILSAEAEAAENLEAAIEEEIYQQSSDPLDDEYYDELGAPDFAVCVYADRIEVKAYGPGIGDLLPKKGRKYIGCQGNIRWQYPLSSLPELKRLNRPVVNVEELQCKH